MRAFRVLKALANKWAFDTGTGHQLDYDPQFEKKPGATAQMNFLNPTGKTGGHTAMSGQAAAEVADYLASHLYRWLCTPSSKLYDHALHR